MLGDNGLAELLRIVGTGMLSPNAFNNATQLMFTFARHGGFERKTRVISAILPFLESADPLIRSRAAYVAAGQARLLRARYMLSKNPPLDETQLLSIEAQIVAGIAKAKALGLTGPNAELVEGLERRWPVRLGEPIVDTNDTTK